MGLNVVSCCHKCKVKKFHYRGEEGETINPFYRKHESCMRANPNNVETLDDQYQERNWMRDGSYADDK